MSITLNNFYLRNIGSQVVPRCLSTEVPANVGNALYSTRNNEALITPGGKTTCMMIYTIRNCVITSDGSTTSSAVPLYSTGPGAESPETYGPK